MICRKAVLSRGKSSGKCSFERLAHGIVMPCSEDWRVENAVGFIKVTVVGRRSEKPGRALVKGRSVTEGRFYNLSPASRPSEPHTYIDGEPGGEATLCST